MYCFVGDLLGFSNIILNLPEEAQARRVSEWLHLSRAAARQFELPHSQLVSDTIFAGAEGNKEGLNRLLAFSRHLLEEGISQAFPIRGAITFGDVTWSSDVSFGRAIVNAYSLGNKQNWVGVSCETLLPDIEDLWDIDRVVCYPAPLKEGPIMLRPVVAWLVPAFETLVKQMNREGLFKEQEALPWSWGEKVQNTVLFALYLRLLKSQPEAGPKNFYGFLPIQLLDLSLKPPTA